MRPVAACAAFRRSSAMLACGFALVTLIAAAFPAEAKSPALDRERAAASRALAQRYWVENGLDQLPQHYDRGRFQHAVQGEDDPYNIVAAIAVATLASNPGRDQAVLDYLNNALLPFALAHKSQYLCLFSEVFYNSQSTDSELKGLAASKNPSQAMPVAFIEYAYFLIKTQPTLDHLKLKIPADNGIPETVGTFQKTLKPDGGSLITSDAVRLDCEH
jgi:hypothetical protein